MALIAAKSSRATKAYIQIRN